MDVDDLRQEFDVYRDGSAVIPSAIERYAAGTERVEIGERPRDTAVGDTWAVEDEVEPSRPVEVSYGAEPVEVEQSGTVVYRPGMTMEDLEREAIAAALAEVRGNRRKAAQVLAIGERTLYRKIKKFGLDED